MFGKKASALIIGAALTLVGWGTVLADNEWPSENPTGAAHIVQLGACIMPELGCDPLPGDATFDFWHDEGSLVLHGNGFDLGTCLTGDPFGTGLGDFTCSPNDSDATFLAFEDGGIRLTIAQDYVTLAPIVIGLIDGTEKVN